MAENVIEKTIALPFSINSYGALNVTTDPQKIWADRVLSVIGTMKKERIFRSTFGTELPSKLLDTTDAVIEQATSELVVVFAEQLPALTFIGVSTEFDETQNVITINVSYTIPNSEDPETIAAKIAIDGIKQLLEENK